MVLEAGEPDLPDQVERAAPPLVLVDAANLERDLDVLDERAEGQRVVFLRDVTDLGVDAVDGAAAVDDLPAARRQKTDDEIQKRRPAASRGPDDPHEATPPHALSPPRAGDRKPKTNIKAPLRPPPGGPTPPTHPPPPHGKSPLLNLVRRSS